MNQKIISLTIAGVAVVAVVAFAIFGDLDALTGGSADSTVASVNSAIITQQELDTRMAQTEQVLAAQGQSAQLQNEQIRSQLEQQVLDQMITETLVLQKARESGVTVTEEEINAEFNALVQQAGGQQALDAYLKQQDLAEEEFRTSIEEQLLAQKYLEENVDTSGVEVTDEEVQSFYDEVSASQENVPPLSEVEEQIRTQLRTQEENELYTTFTQELRADAEIEILL